MNLDQQSHDVGIAFATVRMQTRISDSDDNSETTRERQFLEFITDYTFASSAFVSNMDMADKLKL